MSKEIAIAFVMIAAGFGPAIGIGLIGSAAMNAIGRNPEAAGAVQGAMLIALAMAEAIAVYCLVVALVLKFV